MTSGSSSRKAKAQAAAPRQGANKAVIGAVVAVLVVVAVVVAVALGARGSGTATPGATASAASALPVGATGPGGGIVVNPGKAKPGAPTLDLYEDFQCPICGQLEKLFGAQIRSLAAAGDVKLVTHTMSFLDDNLHNDSSLRAASAAACAADAGRFGPYHDAVYAGQPAKEGQGYTDAQLESFATTGRHHRQRPQHLAAVRQERPAHGRTSRRSRPRARRTACSAPRPSSSTARCWTCRSSRPEYLTAQVKAATT